MHYQHTQHHHLHDHSQTCAPPTLTLLLPTLISPPYLPRDSDSPTRTALPSTLGIVSPDVQDALRTRLRFQTAGLSLHLVVGLCFERTDLSHGEIAWRRFSSGALRLARCLRDEGIRPQHRFGSSSTFLHPQSRRRLPAFLAVENAFPSMAQPLGHKVAPRVSCRRRLAASWLRTAQSLVLGKQSQSRPAGRCSCPSLAFVSIHPFLALPLDSTPLPVPADPRLEMSEHESAVWPSDQVYLRPVVCTGTSSTHNPTILD